MPTTAAIVSLVTDLIGDRCGRRPSYGAKSQSQSHKG
jgi:hypothetical protein